MDAKDLPEGTGFYDVDGIPVAVLAWDHCLAFNLSDGHSITPPARRVMRRARPL